MKSEIKPVFRDEVILDVTNYAAMRPNESCGYLCGCTVSVFPDGRIVLSENSSELENFCIHDLIQISTNINSFDPDYLKDISFMTEEKNLRISFSDAAKKHKFIEILENLEG